MHPKRNGGVQIISRVGSGPGAEASDLAASDATVETAGRSKLHAHHLRFAQHRALGRKVNDEFIVPLCRGHHREVHRCGNEAGWWKKTGIDPTVPARALWLETHPLLTDSDKTGIQSANSLPAVGTG